MYSSPMESMLQGNRRDIEFPANIIMQGDCKLRRGAEWDEVGVIWTIWDQGDGNESYGGYCFHLQQNNVILIVQCFNVTSILLKFF